MRSAILLFFCFLLIHCTQDKIEEQQQKSHPGLEVYNKYCKNCHGTKGDLGLSAATNLITSEISKEDAIAMVTEGKGTMQSFQNLLSKDDIEKVVSYVITLRSEN